MRTLKDLKRCGEERDRYYIDDLRSLAIERARECLKTIRKQKKEEDSIAEWYHRGKLWELMEFFNLTEDDLKEVKK